MTGGARIPTLAQTGYIGGALLFGITAYWAITQAMRLGEISVITPFRYSRLVFAMVIGMVIFRDPHGHRMITTPVKRVLGEPGGKMIYVETENSVYRLEIHGEPLFPMRAAGE